MNITIQAGGGLRGWAQAFQARLDPTAPPDPAQPGVTQNTSPKNKVEKTSIIQSNAEQNLPKPGV